MSRQIDSVRSLFSDDVHIVNFCDSALTDGNGFVLSCLAGSMEHVETKLFFSDIISPQVSP